MLVCLFVTSMTYRLISLSTSSRCRFQTGPGRRPGRAGPNLQPRGRLGPVQRQRDACCRRPGHMKANALCPVPPSSSSSPSLLLLALLLLFLHQSSSHLPCPSTLHSQPPLHYLDAGRKRDVLGGKSRGQTRRFAPLSSFYSPSGEKLTLSSSTLFLHRPPPPFSPWLRCPGRVFVTVTYKTVCYMRVNGCEESRNVVVEDGVE